MQQIQIRGATDEDAACLMRELAAYAPKRVRRSIVVEIEQRSNADLMALLSATETCVTTNGIRSVRIELDGQRYALAPR
jgi:hypothetical protein